MTNTLNMEVALEFWGTGRDWKNSKTHDRKSLDCLEKTISESTDVKNEVSKGNEPHVIENW